MKNGSAVLRVKNVDDVITKVKFLRKLIYGDIMEKTSKTKKVRVLSLSRYVEEALKKSGIP